MTPNLFYRPTHISPSASECSIDKNSQVFDRIAECIIEYPVYVPLDKFKKNSGESGWQLKKNLIDRYKVNNHLQNGNVGLILGKWFNGSTYVLFDIEEEGTLPEDLKAVIEPHTTISQKTIHGGHNRIVGIENKKAYEILNSYQTTITSLTDNEEEDLELITNGATPLPPSEVSHRYCSENKDCNGLGTDSYTTVSINPEAPPIGLDSIKRLGDLLGLEAERTDDLDYNSEDIGNVPSPRPSFDIPEEFKQNVPSVEHKFKDRLEYMKFGDWKGQELFIQLWNGNFENVSGSNKQGKAECKLANYIGFFFGKNERMVRLLMDMAPFDTHYQKYPSHRKALLEYATSVDWVYCDELHLETKLTVAMQIWIEDRISLSKLANKTGLSKRHIRTVKDTLESEGSITTEYDRNELILKNKEITEGYIVKLDNIAEDRNENTNDTIDKVDV